MSRFLIVDDHPLFRDALRRAVEAATPAPLVREAAGLDEAERVLERDGEEGFDLALLDLAMPGVTGFEGVTRLRERFPRLPILVVSAQGDRRAMRQALSLGVAGFVPKSADATELAQAIRTVLGGGVYRPAELSSEEADEAPAGGEAGGLERRLATLTPQQLRVLGMVRQGLQNKQIAYELGVGETTVKAHVSEILRKLGVISRTQAVVETAKLDLGGVGPL